MSHSSAARTNLSSQKVNIHRNHEVGRGSFRIAYMGTYVGGLRNQQDAVCKCFQSKFSSLEKDFFASDFQIADKAIEYAAQWNVFCQAGKEILMTRGYVTTTRDGTSYLVEPMIRYFEKFTSNNGWIADENDVGWAVLALEAFSHYTYHRSGGSLIVCDLQGRHLDNTRYRRGGNSKTRFELTDPAICSRHRGYGPTDLGEKGIESFFANHVCNRFCHNGGTWASPRTQRRWFEASQGTSMLRSTMTHLLDVNNRVTFTIDLDTIDDSDGSGDY